MINLSSSLIISFLLSLSGFIFLLYHKLSQLFIERIIRINKRNGVDILDKKNTEYFANYFEKWTSGGIYTSYISKVLGIIMIIFSAYIILKEHSFLYYSICFVFSILMSIFFIVFLKRKVQLLPFFILFILLIYYIYLKI